ncbi:MAG: NADPH-dependent 7-cyano-7-deazaguanine reductase QueF [Candidatus Marinimicrobia bacterium]|nr:NADPH-dependent 7-cyano-7-deazaguanine reductase QueF [Candidatus Neomarinimicrobiota bacterium]
MPKAEGIKLPFGDQGQIRPDLLETLPYEGEDQTIHLNYPEFSAVCPFSGLPDIATIMITYVPSDKIVELKSLKYYYISFRNVGIYQEDMTNRIYQDMKKILKPQSLYIKTIYNIRGGIETVCEIGKK